MRTITVLTLTLVAFFGLQCSQSTDTPAGKPDSSSPPDHSIGNLTASETSLLNSSNRFGFKLFREILADEPDDKNVFISPLSASYALAMCYNGAAGKTRDAVATALQISGLTVQDVNESYRSLTALLVGLDPEVEVNIANSFWYRLGLPVKQEFVDLNQSYFDALVRELDFSRDWAADTINDWVKRETRDKITEIVKKPIPSAAVAYLMNAIYFKGSWTVSFDSARTAPGLFRLADGSVVMPEMMVTDTAIVYFENELFQAVDLPYSDGLYSMVILLPRAGKTTDDILAELSDETWSGWMGNFEEDTVPLIMPKFRLSYEVTLNRMLVALGMGIAFEPGLADFSNMVSDAELAISVVKQKSFVQVDEQGTEAAAVTVVEYITVSDEPSREMRVDHPFIFAVRERTSGTVLFIGRIAEPVWEN